MFVVVCISILLTEAVWGQNFLPVHAKRIPAGLEWRQPSVLFSDVPGWDIFPFRPLQTKPLTGHIMPPASLFLSPVPADRVVTHFGFFCKTELELEKTIHLPLRLRLGSLEYCNQLEGK